MTVTISRSAWHYRLHERAYISHAPQSICPYFWRIVFAVLLFPFWPIGRRVLTDGFAECVFLGLAAWFFGVAVLVVMPMHFGPETFPWWLQYLAGLGILTAGVAAALALFILGAWLHDKRDSRKRASDSLLSARLQAAKHKVCPFIDWTD